MPEDWVLAIVFATGVSSEESDSGKEPSVTTDSTACPKNSDLEECDLVMKGGIASGVVYPRAILKLKEKYRFRNIGGGSVGALAAALTAAAEFGRETCGFERLEREQGNLDKPGFLLRIFRASENTQPLLDTLLDLSDVGNEARANGQSGTKAILRNLWMVLFRNCPKIFVGGALIGSALGVAMFFVAAEALQSSLSEVYLNLFMLAFGLLFGLLSGPLVVMANLVWILIGKVPKENFHGLCLGSGLPGAEGDPLLTDWLNGALQSLAGIEGDTPLTFAHLANKEIPRKKPNDTTPAIALKMLTTNLSHREPYEFPRETNTFLFKKEDMDRFFPIDVVEYMVSNSNEVAGNASITPPSGYHFLPQGGALPVIVPVRMAIGFPILLSAVPLYTVKESAWIGPGTNPGVPLDPCKDLQLNLFSDGGICSNFPIHFFDSWLPERPTFGINLTSIPAAGPGEGFSVNDLSKPLATNTRIKKILDPANPWLPGPADPDSREWNKVKGLPGFFGAILGSAMNYRDAMQSRLTSYQERVVQIPLSSNEGGLNLNMGVDVISSMANKGGEAGSLLLDRYAREGSFGFKHHRWVRLRVLLSELETQLEGIGEALASVIDEDLVGGQLGSDGFPHHFLDDPEKRIADATEFLGRLSALIAYLEEMPDYCRFPPIPDEDPQPTLRITPKV